MNYNLGKIVSLDFVKSNHSTKIDLKLKKKYKVIIAILESKKELSLLYKRSMNLKEMYKMSPSLSISDVSVPDAAVPPGGGRVRTSGYTGEIDTVRGIPSGERDDWRHVRRGAYCR